MQIETQQYNATIVNVTTTDNANETPVCQSNRNASGPDWAKGQSYPPETVVAASSDCLTFAIAELPGVMRKLAPGLSSRGPKLPNSRRFGAMGID
jgi:hypothetical protein